MLRLLKVSGSSIVDINTCFQHLTYLLSNSHLINEVILILTIKPEPDYLRPKLVQIVIAQCLMIGGAKKAVSKQPFASFLKVNSLQS